MSDLQYVLDRFAIQDLIATYGLGHDLHQPGQDNNVLVQWGKVFAPDAVIDTSAVGGPSALSLQEFAEMLRGPGLDGSRGVPAHFDAWQHREGYATVSIDGDTATAIILSCTCTRRSTAQRTSCTRACGTTVSRACPKAGGSPTGAWRTFSSTISRAWKTPKSSDIRHRGARAPLPHQFPSQGRSL